MMRATGIAALAMIVGWALSGCAVSPTTKCEWRSAGELQVVEACRVYVPAGVSVYQQQGGGAEMWRTDRPQVSNFEYIGNVRAAWFRLTNVENGKSATWIARRDAYVLNEFKRVGSPAPIERIHLRGEFADIVFSLEGNGSVTSEPEASKSSGGWQAYEAGALLLIRPKNLIACHEALAKSKSTDDVGCGEYLFHISSDSRSAIYSGDDPNEKLTVEWRAQPFAAGRRP